MSDPIKIRWLIAHDPEYLFIRTAEEFANQVDAELPGQFDFEILTRGYYNKKYGDVPELGWAPERIDEIEIGPGEGVKTIAFNEDVNQISRAWFQAMDDGKIQMGQTQITVIGAIYDEFMTLDLPFLFAGHRHVSAVLDGPIGDGLMNRLGDNSQVRGLAFTYSGGFRMVGSNSPIENLETLKSKSVITVPSSREFFKSLAYRSLGRQMITSEEMSKNVNEGGAVETTYLRFKGKHILKTNHSMFLTTILIANKFFDSLNEEQQKVFKSVAKKVAKLEREWSIEDADVYEIQAAKKGITINNVSAEETEIMKKAAVNQYRFVWNKIPTSKPLTLVIKKVIDELNKAKPL
jgi:hypothetical protein